MDYCWAIRLSLSMPIIHYTVHETVLVNVANVPTVEIRC